MEIPLNAQYIRNIIMGAHATHDHIVHFYHLTALDWVDIVSSLDGDPKETAKLAAKLSDWPRNTVQEIRASKERIATFVKSGQLGIYSSGYWGHPAMKLAPEVNLLAVHHYLQALEYQRRINQVVAILGSKTPHVQTIQVGGMTNQINPDSPTALGMERLYLVKTLLDEADEFVKKVLLVDTAAVGAMYADWTGHGKGVVNYLSAPDMPMDTKGTKFHLPGGYIPGGDLSKFTPIKSFQDDFFAKNVKESIKHSWYEGDWDRHPYEEDTVPKYKDWKESVTENQEYSWVKAPTFQGEPAQVGPLANVLCMVAAGHEGAAKYVTETLKTVSALVGSEVGVGALHSTIGRIAARSIRCAILNDTMQDQFNALMENIKSGDLKTFEPPDLSKSDGKELQGFGFHEAPRGILSHWVVIKDRKIKNYQAVVPSTWNAGPRNSKDDLGPYEASLIGTPVVDQQKPLEILRTIHSFDPCLACAVHLVDKKQREIVRVKVL